MGNWQFYQHTDRKWSWCNVSLSTRKSVCRFESFIQAISDATRHGFEPGVSKITAIQADRRSTPR
jgi:hypothetical protein